MKTVKSVVILSVFAVLVFSMLPRPIIWGASTLADTINGVLNSSWANDPASISVATIFGKDSTSAFDSASVTSPDQWAWDKMIASEDGYSSGTINSNVQSMMSTATMTGYLPVTDTNPTCFLVYDRYDIPLYDQYSTWNKAGAIAEINGNLAGQSPLLGFGTSPWYYATRYYDEYMQDADICLKLGDVSEAASLWAAVNANNWEGSYYEYRSGQTIMECEVGFFAAIVANYDLTVGGIPNFDRVATDIYTKLLANGWNSPLWGAPSAMYHATSNSQLRLENTLGGVEAIQMFYTLASSSYRSNWVNMLTGSPPAWQDLMSVSGWGTSGPDDPALKAALLFLYGIVPDTGSLAIPANEWHYEDWTSMMPSSLFKFDYSGHSIQIPVNAGNIKFLFGTSAASYNFPSNGVYRVQFSSDWNTVQSASEVSGLTQFHFLSGGSVTPTEYGSILVSGTYESGAVAFQASIDSQSYTTSVPRTGYTFTNMPVGSHTVYGLLTMADDTSGHQASQSVTVSQGQTATVTLDFPISVTPINNATRPVWWPRPLPWPLPTPLNILVGSPVYMFGGAGIGIALIAVGASRLTKPKYKAPAKKPRRFTVQTDE